MTLIHVGTFAYNESLGLPPPNFDIDEPVDLGPPRVFDPDLISSRNTDDDGRLIGGIERAREQERREIMERMGVFVGAKDDEALNTDIPKRRRAFTDELAFLVTLLTPKQTEMTGLTKLRAQSALLPDVGTFSAWVERENVRILEITQYSYAGLTKITQIARWLILLSKQNR